MVNNRVETDNAWCVNIEEIKKRNYNRRKEPKRVEKLMEDPAVLLKRFKEERAQAQDIHEQIRVMLTEALLK